MSAVLSITNLKRLAYNVGAWGVILVLAFPLLWAIVTSVKPKIETYGFPPAFLPSRITILHFERLFFETPFPTYFLNSVFVSCTTTLLVIAVATLGAYSLVRFRYPGRRTMAQMILITYLLPAVVLVIPLYVIVASLGLADSLWGLVVAYTTFSMPFALWLLRAFVAAMAIDLEDAARVDGASRMGAFFDVVLPQALPGIISTALFTFILSWNEYLYALVFITTDSNKTLPAGVAHLFWASHAIEWNLLMAASVVMTVPIVIFFSVLQRHLTRGFGAGAVKG